MYDLNWKRIPAYTTIHSIIQNTSGTELEQCLREYNKMLANNDGEKQFIGYDGKVLRGQGCSVLINVVN